MKGKIIICALAAMSLSSCAVYKKYKSPTKESLSEVVGSSVEQVAQDTTSIEWQKFFTDEKLQALITKALEQNSDLRIAKLNIDQSEAMLLASKLAYLPSLGVNAQGTASSFKGSDAVMTYNLPLSTQWEIDLSGKLLNRKRISQAQLEQTKEYVSMVELQLISAVANSYYTLVMLDEQLSIARQFVKNQTRNVEIMEKFKEVGMQSETAVNQSKASLYNTKTTVLDLELQIKLVENALSLVLNETPQTIERAKLKNSQIVGKELESKVSLERLAARPDVMVAEANLKSNFYGVNLANAAFYPSLSLSGSAGWTNNVGAIVNPGNLLLSAIGSLAAPIFNKGVNRANLKVAKSKYEQSLISFEKTLLSAGNEVNGLLVEQEKLTEKHKFRLKQVGENAKAYHNSQELMKHSSSTYLEVLVAQSALLQSKLSYAAEWCKLNQTGINLFKALGGN